jgi:hypothetical protein
MISAPFHLATCCANDHCVVTRKSALSGNEENPKYANRGLAVLVGLVGAQGFRDVDARGAGGGKR